MKKQKRRLQTRILAEALFWLHFLISIAILVMGLFIPWFWVVIIIIALRLQQIILHGCIITILQYREGGIP
ncbi:MAG TPA: hypothetical protein VFP32_02390, partial [Candidatus Saccharimonadales bacterium]|nr:hypothetical protein [Candidatus Saccharimonadales bacterium]